VRGIIGSKTDLSKLCPSGVKTTSFTKEVWPLNSFSVLPDLRPWILGKSREKNIHNPLPQSNTEASNKTSIANVLTASKREDIGRRKKERDKRHEWRSATYCQPQTRFMPDLVRNFSMLE